MKHKGSIARVLVLGALGAGGLLGAAEWRWRAKTSEFIKRLHGGLIASPSSTFSLAELSDLPVPVARYFRAVLREGQPLFSGARLTQEGDFLLQPRPDGWRPFTATQHVTVCPAGFVWDARIRMAPGVTVCVRDAYLDGVGYMQAALLGLIRLAAVQGTPDIASGSLYRYLAEAVWCPTALLPSQGVVWSPLDATHARATLRSGATEVALDFQFGEDSLVQGIFTSGRARDVNGKAVATPWQGRFFDYEERGGMRIPVRGEVEWLLPEGPQMYWRGHIVEAIYE